MLFDNVTLEIDPISIKVEEEFLYTVKVFVDEMFEAMKAASSN
jgi:hypothetical protein